MATGDGIGKMRLILISLFSVIGFAFGGDFIITHAPDYLTFRKDAGKLATSEIPKVISALNGFQLDQDLSWDGMEQGSLFKRPKANVIMTVDGLDGAKLNTKNIAKYATDEDALVNTEYVTNHIESNGGDKKPLIVDFSVDNTIFDIRSHHPELFSSLPATYEKVREAFISGSSGFSPADLVSLNITNDADLLFLGELHVIRQILTTLKAQGSLLRGGMPDFFHLRVMGLRRVIQEHGADSAQVKDAISLLNTIVNEVTEHFRELYGDNVVVQLVTMSTPETSLRRKGRSLMAESEIDYQEDNISWLAEAYDEDYPMLFNIILWTVVFWFVALFFICWGMWFIDPGRDSIIYRMTAQRMKKD